VVVVASKSVETVFLEPFTLQQNIATELLDDWKTKKFGLEEWEELFLLANSTQHHEILTKETIGQGKSFFLTMQRISSPLVKL
jgi:hypothetical protein